MRSHFWMGPIAALLLLAASACPTAAQTKLKAHKTPVPAANADALVHKMVAVYQAANSIQETAEATIAQAGGSAYIQTSTIKFQRPLFLATTSQDPYLGSIDLHCDGKIITIYSGKQNIYTRRTAPSTIREVVQTADHAAADSLGISQAPMLSPLSFLISGKMPEAAKSFRYGGVKMMNGRKTVLILGQIDPQWVQGLLPNVRVELLKREVALWIDPKTNLLVKAAAAVTWKSTLPGQSKSAKATAPGGFVFQEVHRGTVLNGSISAGDFSFTPPKSAVEKFQQTR